MNIGKIIKIVSICLLFINVIFLMYLSTIIWDAINYDNGILFFTIYSIISFIIAFIITILLYGFGDLIDTNRQILNKLKK